MKAGYKETWRRLWHSAPYWRGSVIGASVFTVLSVLYLLSGSPGIPSTDTVLVPPPPPARDAASEARLDSYEATFAATKDTHEEGQRCEAITTAYDKLGTSDLQEGRSVVLSTRSRIAALAEGQRCHDAILASNGRFEALHRALAAATGRMTVDASHAVGAAYESLSGFDRTRSRFIDETESISKAQGIAEANASSEKRINDLEHSVVALQTDRSPAAYLEAASDLSAITDFDRARLTSKQQQTIATAEQAAETIGDSRTRLAQLATLLSTAQSDRSPQAEQQLIEGVIKITPFDEALATPEQSTTLAKARDIAAPLAWTLLENRLTALGQDASPANYNVVAEAYDLLQHWSSAQTQKQQDLMAQARKAAEFLPASDARLQTMREAAAAWAQQRMAAKQKVLQTLADITSFDRSRFDASLAEEWDLLTRASVIVRGPEIGLTAANKDHMPIYVFTRSSAEQDRQVAGSLSAALAEAGYRVTTDPREAVLTTQVSVQNVSQPELDTNTGAVASYRIVAQINVVARWASDDTVLFSGPVVASAEDAIAQVRVKALLNGIGLIVTRFQQVTSK